MKDKRDALLEETRRAERELKELLQDKDEEEEEEEPDGQEAEDDQLLRHQELGLQE